MIFLFKMGSRAIILCMNITFMLFYFDPENATINYLYRPIWQRLMAMGHHINIITPNPTRGVSEEEQVKYKKILKEERDGMTIYRVASYTYKPKNFSKFRLLRRYISVSQRLAAKLKTVRSDVVFIATNPPLLYSYLVTRYCTKKKIPVVYNVQDIYPDNVFSPKTFKYKLFNYFQVKSLSRAKEIITISETMRNTLLRKGDFNRKISVIYNFDISEVSKLKGTKAPHFFDPQQFNIVYAGNIGYVQDLDVILSAAKKLMHNPKLTFHIFGEGSQATRIANRIRDEHIVNVTYYPAHSVEDSALLYKYADVNLVSILPGIIETALPLKTASCLAAGKPIVFIGLETFYHQEAWPEKVRHLYAVNYRNVDKLAETIEKLLPTKSQVFRHDEVLALFDKENNVKQYVSIIAKYAKK